MSERWAWTRWPPRPCPRPRTSARRTRSRSMPHADVVVIGAGLAGLVAAARLAEAGASVTLVAKGHASTHWGSGGIDVAAPAGASTPAEGVAALARASHPYAVLARDVEPAMDWLLGILAAGR